MQQLELPMLMVGPTRIAQGVVPSLMRLRDGKAERYRRAMKCIDKQTALVDKLRLKMRELERIEQQAKRSNREAKKLGPVLALLRRQVELLSRGVHVE